MLDTTTTALPPTPVAPATTEAVTAPVVAPAPASQIETQPAADQYVSRFSAEEISRIESADIETAREWAKGLSFKERQLLLNGGLAALKPAETQKTDPAPAPADPAVEAPTAPETTPPETGTEPPAGDQIAWEMTEEELAALPPKALEAYKALVDATEKLENIHPPAPDPYADDPIVAWRKKALESGKTEVPDFTLADINASIPGGLNAFYEKLDGFHAKGNAAAWEQGLQSLLDAVVEHTKSRTLLQAQIKLSETTEARQEGEAVGEFRAEVRGSTREFLKGVPEFAKAAEPLFIRSGDREVLNPKNPAADFVNHLQSQVDIFHQMVIARGTEKALQVFWLDFQSEKAGGLNRHMANIRGQEGISMAKRMRASLDGFLAKQKAPSVGTIQVPANGGNNQVLYHGFDLTTLKTPEQVRAADAAIRRTAGPQAAAGLAAAMMAAVKR